MSRFEQAESLRHLYHAKTLERAALKRLARAFPERTAQYGKMFTEAGAVLLGIANEVRQIEAPDCADCDPSFSCWSDSAPCHKSVFGERQAKHTSPGD